MSDSDIRLMLKQLVKEADGYVNGRKWKRDALLSAIAAARAALDAAPEGEGDRSLISDGYHTFAELYEHRHALMLALMHAKPSMCWFSCRHADGELPFGSKDWFIVGAELSTGAITYHLPIRLLELAKSTGATELTAGKPWDGHTANDVVSRLSDWASSALPATPPAPEPGDVGEFVAQLKSYAENGTPIRLIPSVVDRAATLLQQLAAPAPAVVPIPVSERLPEEGDCDTEGFCWFWSPEDRCWFWERIESDFCRRYGAEFEWLPAHAIPLPAPQGGEVEG